MGTPESEERLTMNHKKQGGHETYGEQNLDLCNSKTLTQDY